MLGVQPRDLIEGNTEEKEKKTNLTAQFEIFLKSFEAWSDSKKKIFLVVHKEQLLKTL